MKHDPKIQFGKYLQQLRKERHLGIRELARKAGVDDGGLTRLEQGKVSPRPSTLQALGAALEVPLADLFARAGYITPSELPGMSAYLRTRYDRLPEDALVSIDEYVQRLIKDHDLDSDGPAPVEDELKK